MARWRQDRKTGELVPVMKPSGAGSPAIHGDIEPFVSPLDGTVIGSRRDLRIHNERHDVVQHQEFGENNGEAYIQRKQQERLQQYHGQTKQDRQERLDAIIPIVTEMEYKVRR